MTEDGVTRVCECGAVVRRALNKPAPIIERTCESCGKNHYFSIFEKMDVALSEQCNYKCIMCRRSEDPAILGIHSVLDVMEQAREIGMKVVSFCGGEPFMHPKFVEIAEHAIKLGFKVQLTTNGSLVTKEKLERLAGLDCMTLSIDALRDTHDRIRGVSGAFDRAIEALNLGLDLGITCGTNTVVQKANSQEILPLFHYLIEATQGRIDYVRHAPVEVTSELAHLMVDEEAIGHVRDQLKTIAEECERRDIYFSHRKQLLEHLELFMDKWTRHKPLGGCKIPQKFIGYSHLGFYLCWHQGKSIRASSLIEALSSEIAQKVVDEAWSGECVGCNALTYSRDEEWNDGILEGKLVRSRSLVDGITTICGQWSDSQ